MLFFTFSFSGVLFSNTTDLKNFSIENLLRIPKIFCLSFIFAIYILEIKNREILKTFSISF
jgi:hypothetical protein